MVFVIYYILVIINLEQMQPNIGVCLCQAAHYFYACFHKKVLLPYVIWILPKSLIESMNGVTLSGY